MKLPASLAFLVFVTSLTAQKAADSPWGDFVEKDFPFFSSVLDCRDLGEGFPKDNLTPRGLILNLGHNLWACFDTDLLRIACIWEGEPGKPPVTPAALAPGSYHVAGQKTKDGQEDLPKPIGKVWLSNGIYPGWQIIPKSHEKVMSVEELSQAPSDPRQLAPSADEIGKGPLQKELGRFLAVHMSGKGFLLEYQIGDRLVTDLFSVERLNTKGQLVQPTIRLNISSVVGKGQTILARHTNGHTSTEGSPKAFKHLILYLGNSHNINFSKLSITGGTIEISDLFSADSFEFEYSQASIRWPETLTTKATLSQKPDAYVIDDIPLPVPNPWKRNVRLADIAFLNDQGDAAGVTFDGDVWLISGLKGDLEAVTWKRFASGLHEPMSIVARRSAADGRSKMGDGASPSAISHSLSAEILVFDRNGIWKLVDTNGDKECDRYEMFCNLFAQTAETREFPNSMKLGPKGELYISKGGQEGTTRGKHNGTVIKVAADGKSFEVIGYGLRQPFIGVNAQTGFVTASDQQGHYVPSTPLHVIRDHQFYGHLPTIAEKEKYPETIADPLTWIPHPVNPSGVTQTWLLGSKMGPVDGELIHIGYNRPELFRVLMNKKCGTGLQPVQSPEGQVKNLSHFLKPQAAVVSFSREFDFPTLNAIVNPADGQLYVTGFQVWGTVVKRLSGLARVRWTGKPRVLLQEVTPTDKGVVLRFNAKLDAKLATNPDSYSAERWNYKRTPEYGSPHLKLDGSNGQEWMNASSAYLSTDGQSVLVAFPEMKTCHQMRVGWGLQSADGLKAANTAYFSPWELMPFDAAKLGFEPGLKIDLTPRKSAVAAAVKPTVEEGERLYQMFGCMACHSTDGTLVGKVGPSWKGLFGSERDIAKGTKGKVKADEAYLRESILNPSAKVVKGFEKFDTGMPIYAGILNDSQIESLILYIKSLK
jgi:cytochrome c2